MTRLDALAAAWPQIEQALLSGRLEWSTELRSLDLAMLRDRATHPSHPVPVPGRPTLRERWGCTDYRVRCLLQNEKPTANRQETDSEPTANRQEGLEPNTDTGEKPTGDRQETDSEPTADRLTRREGSRLPGSRLPADFSLASADGAAALQKPDLAAVCAAWMRHNERSRWTSGPPKSVCKSLQRIVKEHGNDRVIALIDWFHGPEGHRKPGGWADESES